MKTFLLTLALLMPLVASAATGIGILPNGHTFPVYVNDASGPKIELVVINPACNIYVGDGCQPKPYITFIQK